VLRLRSAAKIIGRHGSTATPGDLSTPGQLAVTSRMQVSPGYYFRVIFAGGVGFSRVRAE
jgi:hypothetical protein